MRRTQDQPCHDWLLSRVFYLAGDVEQPATYQAIKEKLEGLDAHYSHSGNYLFYLAVAPTLFLPVIWHLGDAGLTDEAPATGGGWSSRSRSART